MSDIGKAFLLIVGVFVVLTIQSVVFGVVFADLWHMSFAAIGLPAVTPLEAAIGAMLVAMVLYRGKGTENDTKKMFTSLAAKIAIMFLTWGMAYVVGWIL